MKKLLCLLLAMMLLFAFAACDAEKEPVRSNDKEKQPVVSQTEPEIAEGETVIIKVSVYHGNGEITENRFSAVKGNTLAETLLGRTFITEDMLTVDGEYANPDLGNSWSLYIDGVFTTETWDLIMVDNGVEYTFEYTAEIEFTDNVNEGTDEGYEEDLEEEYVGEPEVTEP